MELSDLTAHLAAERRDAGHPLTVGISGFGGSGKSSLAAALAPSIPGCVLLRGDDFLDPARSHRRSRDWDGVERTRLVNEVLRPFRRRAPSAFRRFDWGLRALGDPEPLPHGEVLLVDLIGLFHPETEHHLDVRIWCDVDLRAATAQGKARDARLGRDHVRLWDEVWVPNEIDFVADFDPRRAADIALPPLALETFAVS